MVSPHVDRGRRNLAATAIALMRQVGMVAFQTTLLPHLSPDALQQLNHTPLADLRAAVLRVADEVARVFAVTEPVVTDAEAPIKIDGN